MILLKFDFIKIASPPSLAPSATLLHGHDTDYHHDQNTTVLIPNSVAFRAMAAPTSLLFSTLVTFCAAISLSFDDAAASVLPFSSSISCA